MFVFVLIKKCFVVCILLGYFYSCKSVPQLEGKSVAQYFKAAEELRVVGSNREAIHVYQLVQVRFPDDLALLIESEFSIAQIYFSWPGYEEKARQHYGRVLRLYEQPHADDRTVLNSFKYLSKKNLDSLTID